MPTTATDAAILDHAHPLDDDPSRYDPLLEAIGDARVVLIGEASHGTHEFYDERAAITKRLIREKGFTAVAVEADWPDAYRVNTYVRGQSSAADAERALAGFERFPTWMWRNTVVVDFAEWLRERNQSAPDGEQAGFYGLDLYSLYTSAANVVEVLDRIDPEAARRARDRYACLEQFGEDSQAYGYAAAFEMDRSCEDQVVAQLVDVQRTAAEYARRDGVEREADAFYLEQNARLVEAAEEYYREMFLSRVSTWNLRDTHMATTLDALLNHLDRPRRPARVVVWEHNSHIGDARATEMSARGEHNVGQLAREKYGRDAFNVGLTTYSGTVTAASDWGAPAERKVVRPGLGGSWEETFHGAHLDRLLLLTAEVHNWPPSPRIERAIGVIYRPETERLSHYFYAQLGEQFDAVIHLDETRALEPLERTQQWTIGEAPATYPFASERG